MSSRSGKGPSSSRGLTVHVRKANKRSVQSRAWLERQLNDPYVAAAQAQGYRSRAAFKLIEMDDRYSLIKPGCLVVDLGAAPGGWAQVAVKRGAAKVLGLDLLPINPVQGATFLEGDFNDEDMPARQPQRQQRALRPRHGLPWRQRLTGATHSSPTVTQDCLRPPEHPTMRTRQGYGKARP